MQAPIFDSSHRKRTEPRRVATVSRWHCTPWDSVVHDTQPSCPAGRPKESRRQRTVGRGRACALALAWPISRCAPCDPLMIGSLTEPKGPGFHGHSQVRPPNRQLMRATRASARASAGSSAPAFAIDADRLKRRINKRRVKLVDFWVLRVLYDTKGTNSTLVLRST